MDREPLDSGNLHAGDPGDEAGRPPRREPWPWILAALLAFMIGTSLSFYHIAATHPDPVIDTAPHPGVER